MKPTSSKYLNIINIAHRIKHVIFVFLVLSLSTISTATVSTLVKKTEVTPTKEVTHQDSFGRDTPRSTMQGLIHALTEHDNTLTAHYLDTAFLKTIKNHDEFIHDFQMALDKGGRIDPILNISDNKDGNLVDMLTSDTEKVGTLEINGKELPLLLSKKISKDNITYWQISQETLKQIPKEIAQNQTLMMSLSQNLGFDFFKGKLLFGYDVAHLLSLGVLLVVALVMVWLVVVMIYGALALLYPKLTKRRFAIPPKMVLPLSVVILAYLLPEIMVQAGVPVILRSSVIRAKDVLAWLAMAWLVLRLIDAVFKRAESISVKKKRPEQVSILTLLRKVAKLVMIILAVIIILGNLGFDLTTGLAALSLGGLALAFGAQKTIENLIGSVVVVADRPIHVGDFCRFGDKEGHVIDIGIRSSRIRTLDRTIVTVPNGEFSAMQIENYTARDMYHFLHHLYLQRDASPNELKRLTAGLKAYLLTHPHTNHEWTQVRLSELRQDCFVVEIRCYVVADNVRMFYDKQSELMVDVLLEVENYQVKHALPSQSIQLNQSDETERS